MEWFYENVMAFIEGDHAPDNFWMMTVAPMLDSMYPMGQFLNL